MKARDLTNIFEESERVLVKGEKKISSSKHDF